MARPEKIRLGELLLRQQVITEAQLNDGLAQQKKSGRKLGRVLVNGALGVMQKYAPAATGNAEYHAFSAALYQRLGRHSDAVEEYQTALRLAPQTGTWWVGLGISQEASDRRKEALTSFQRAQSAANLSQELVAYVDQRLRQLR